MATFSFKSSGKTREQRQVEELVQSQTPIGIKTPLALGTKEGILAMNYNLIDQVTDNFRNLLQTNYGERVGQYFIGANLRELCSEYTTQDDFDTQAIERIKSATARWMPFVDLETFESIANRNDNHHTAVIDITITFNVPALNVKGKRVQVTLYAM